MTKVRLAKTQRLLKLNREMQKLEEEKLADAHRQQLSLREEQTNLVDVLSGGSGAQLLPTPMVLNRLRRLDDRQQALNVEIAARTGSLRTVMTRAKHAERLMKEHALLHRRATEEKELKEVIERVLGKTDASLP